jgi:capping protein beta
MKTARNAEEQQKQAALSLLKRLPPQDLDRNLTAFAKIAPHLEQALSPHVSRPLRLDFDPEQNRHFIVGDYNFDGGSYRSPWSNKYFPPPGGETELFKPSERLRRMEETFNDVFDAYKTGYYEGGVSSVYLWDMDEGFAGAFLIHKDGPPDAGLTHGVWDSVHIIEVREPASSNSLVDYKLSTSVFLHVKIGGEFSNETDLGAYITRQAEDKKKKTGEDSHLLHIGRMIEDMEISIRQSLDLVCMAKQREVLNTVRNLETVEPVRLPSPRASLSGRNSTSGAAG